MPQTNERVDAVERDIAEIRSEKPRKGQDEFREMAEWFRSARRILLVEAQAQKAWREEMSRMIDRVIAKSEGLEA
ncbi:hypothetical protein [Microbispora sp. H13382]|uniref:hypothetical protein n=1 Tax=Microbispora sp. H13382 TaxID=2729112 RepID=UPI0016029BED|nr:hypothetical protein [Microbispora sp. H13382]